MLIDIKAAQLLCSRLCHDLVGPVGAVNAGLELLEESAAGPQGADGAGGALDLVGRSADQVTKRVSFFRMAFGQGGGSGGAVSHDDTRSLADAYLAEGTVTLDWPQDPTPGRALDAVWAKLLLNMVLLAAESLPRGGTLAVRLADLPEGLGVAFIASGQGARFKDDVRDVMRPDAPADGLTARNVHGHFAACLAESLGTGIEVDLAEGEVRFAILLPTTGT